MVTILAKLFKQIIDSPNRMDYSESLLFHEGEWTGLHWRDNIWSDAKKPYERNRQKPNKNPSDEKLWQIQAINYLQTRSA